MGIKSLVKQVLVEKENRRYDKLMNDKCVSYSRWLEERETFDGAMPDGLFIFQASDGVMSDSCLGNIGRYFEQNPESMIVYCDEDVISAGESGVGRDGEKWCSPWFKPDWSPDMLKDYFYFGSLVAVRKEFLESVPENLREWNAFCTAEVSQEAEDSQAAEDFRVAGAFQGAKTRSKAECFRVKNGEAYVKWMTACVKAAGGYRKARKVVGHISQVLFHCDSLEEQEKFLKCWGEGASPCSDGEEQGLAEKAVPMVSVIIPSKDNPEILLKCIKACKVASEGGLRRLAKENEAALTYEVIVVDNGSCAENREKIEREIAILQKEGSCEKERSQAICGIQYIYQPMEFNFSAMCNLGAERAKGSFLLFLNDDVELCLPGTLAEMAALAAQEYTGAVGLKLYYPESKKLQHAGITNLPMGPVHKLQFMEDNKCYYFGANVGKRNVLAVTAACLMVEKKKYLEAEGFCEELCVAFNDVDFCFRLYELGYHNVCVNDFHAYHHESLSRGADESVEKLNRLLIERDKLYRRHPSLEGVDPYYSVHLNREGLDTRIEPGYVTVRNTPQEVKSVIKEFDVTGYRQDACLMVRVEDFRKGKIIGYGVILGDNNACYEKHLLLQQANDTSNGGESESENVTYAIPLLGQYRPDLEENMSDQVRVALSGYWLNIKEGAVPCGRYRVGMSARNRVTGMKLLNRTNRYVEL